MSNVQSAGTSSRNKYLDILDEAWQQHLAPREPDAPTIVSLFAGCGGSSLGYSMAGYRELLAVEWDDNAVETFKLNFPEIPVYHGDIHKLTVEECLQLTNLEPGELDVLDGSPPCQGFSTAGKRQIGDLRNQLHHEFVRLLRGLQPKVFIMENVSGLVKGKMKLIFADIMRELKASGYKVRCKLLNAMYFHVPQSRQRLIWIGVRDDLVGDVSFLEAEDKPITIREATADIWHNSESDLPFNADTKTARAMQAARQGEQDPKHFSTFKLFADKPANVLRKDFLGYFHYWHPQHFRPLTLQEWKRLGSFPDSFSFTDKKNGCQQIGNSVPPLFMRAIAKHVRVEILTDMGLSPRLVTDSE